MGSPAPPAFAILDPTSFQKYLLFGNGDGGGARDEFAWAKQNIPFFESSDEDFTTAYYFRWHMMHTHMNATGWTGKDKISKWLITEFTNVIGTHSGAAGHHLMEIRWLRDPVVWKDYIEYWANGANHPYTAWYSAAFFEAYKTLAKGGARTSPKLRAWLGTLYAKLKNIYREQWVASPHLIFGNGTNGMTPSQRCFWKTDAWDSEENSISGTGCRPLSNAVALGEARGLAAIAAEVFYGNKSASAVEAKLWANWSSIFHSALTDVLWNEKIGTFSTLTIAKPGCNATHGSGKPCGPGQPRNETLQCNSATFSRAACDWVTANQPGRSGCVAVVE